SKLPRQTSPCAGAVRVVVSGLCGTGPHILRCYVPRGHRPAVQSRRRWPFAVRRPSMASIVSAVEAQIVRPPLTFEERRALRRLMSDRVRELVPYVESGKGVGRHYSDPAAVDVLSRREFDVLVGVMVGRQDAETASMLNLSKGSVNQSVARLVRRF